MSWTCLVCKKEVKDSNEPDLQLILGDFDYAFCGKCGDIVGENFERFLIALAARAVQGDKGEK